MTNKLNDFLRRCLGLYHEDRNSPSLTFVNSESFFKKRHFLYPLEHTLKQLRYQYSSCTSFFTGFRHTSCQDAGVLQLWAGLQFWCIVSARKEEGVVIVASLMLTLTEVFGFKLSSVFIYKQPFWVFRSNRDGDSKKKITMSNRIQSSCR